MSCVCAAIDTSDEGACLSSDRAYRYALWRRWPDTLSMSGSPDRWMFAVCLNPSTADEHAPDPTLTRIIGFAKRYGYNGIVLGNAFAFRATNPAELTHSSFEKPAGSIGLDNDTHLRNFRYRFGAPVVGWGATIDHQSLRPRENQLRGILGEEVKCWGVTATGAPQHPLYLPADRTLSPFSWRDL